MEVASSQLNTTCYTVIFGCLLSIHDLGRLYLVAADSSPESSLAEAVARVSPYLWNKWRNRVGKPAMELTQSQLQQIAEYVKSQLPDWVYRSEPPRRDIHDRILVVEEELKGRRELMSQGFAAMDKRFESLQHNMDKRFEAMDKRFSMLQWMWGGGIVLITLLMSLYQFVS